MQSEIYTDLAYNKHHSPQKFSYCGMAKINHYSSLDLTCRSFLQINSLTYKSSSRFLLRPHISLSTLYVRRTPVPHNKTHPDEVKSRGKRPSDKW